MLLALSGFAAYAQDGGIANQKANSDFWLLNETEKAKYFMKKGELVSGRATKVQLEHKDLEDLIAVQG